MTCEKIRNELVAYRDGELSERDHARVAQHLGTCVACQQEDAQFALVGQFVSKMERITPSADFAANFRLLLAQEDQKPQEGKFVRWWREWSSGWQMTPMLVGAASLLVFFGYWFVDRPEMPLSTKPDVSVQAVADTVPKPVIERPAMFANYNMLAEMDKFTHFEDIASAEDKNKVATPEQAEPAKEVAQQEDLPPALLRDPSFFLDYPMLRQMEKLRNMEAVLTLPGEGDIQQRG